MKHEEIKISEPILESDFQEALKLVEDQLFYFSEMMADLKGSSSGELLLAKLGGEVVGMLHMRRPGKIFKEIEDKYFDPKNLSEKDETGYISVVAVAKECQGQGVGKRLVLKALELQKEWGAKKMIVHASKSSPDNSSEKLFSSLGFVAGKLHKAPWAEYSMECGPEKFQCNFCGNPCKCDELEMVKYL